MILQLKYRDRCRFKKSSIILLNIQTLASPMNQKISSVAARREEKKALRWTHTSFEPWNDIHLPVSAAFMNINVSHFSWVASCDRNIQLYFPGWIKKRKWKYGSIQLLHLSHKLLLNHAHLFSFEWDHNIRPQNPSCTFWEERWNWEISGKSVKEWIFWGRAKCFGRTRALPRSSAWDPELLLWLRMQKTEVYGRFICTVYASHPFKWRLTRR